MNIRLLPCILLTALLSPAIHAASVDDPAPRTARERPPAADARCAQRPEPGPCKGLFHKFYYDPARNACRSFIYGGCQGAVPFDDQQACEQACLNTGKDKSE